MNNTLKVILLSISLNSAVSAHNYSGEGVYLFEDGLNVFVACDSFEIWTVVVSDSAQLSLDTYINRNIKFAGETVLIHAQGKLEKIDINPDYTGVFHLNEAMLKSSHKIDISECVPGFINLII